MKLHVGVSYQPTSNTVWSNWIYSIYSISRYKGVHIHFKVEISISALLAEISAARFQDLVNSYNFYLYFRNKMFTSHTWLMFFGHVGYTWCTALETIGLHGMRATEKWLKNHVREGMSGMNVSYLLDFFGLGWISAWRNNPCRRNVLCDSHELLFEDVHRFPVASHSLGAVPNTLCQGKPSWKAQSLLNTC